MLHYLLAVAVAVTLVNFSDRIFTFKDLQTSGTDPLLMSKISFVVFLFGLCISDVLSFV